MPDQTSSDVIIQPAGPDQGDIAAQLMYSTHPVLYDDMYRGDRASSTKVCAALWESADTLESHTMAHGAYIDGKLIGFEIGADTGSIEGRGDVENAIIKDLTSSDAYAHYQACWRDRWSYAFPRFPDSTYYVGSLAVLPEWHGKGIGRLLLQDAFERAKASKCKDAQLDLYADNPAFHFYQAMGMEKLSETKVVTLEHTDTPVHYRMIKQFG